MSAATQDEFLNNNSFLGIFLSSFSKRQEIIGYISMILNPIILSIDNEEKDCLDISINSIERYLYREKEKNIKKMENLEKKYFFEGENSIKNFLFSGIPKTQIKFKNNFELEAQKEKEDDDKNNINSKDDNLLDNKEKNFHRNNFLRRTFTEKSNFQKVEEYNNDYKFPLNQDMLFNKLEDAKNEDLKKFYKKLIEQTNNDPNIYSNEGILKILNIKTKEKDKGEELIEIYKENFLFIKKKIELLLQTIIDRIITLPYSLRCICKIIYLLIFKKFPHLSKYQINSFIGKFLFNKCIFPILSLESKNIIDLRIFSLKTKNCLDTIIEILSKANNGSLFNTYLDPEKTIFNQYLIEIIPILNKFYEKIIDVQLPKIIDELIEKTNKKMKENQKKNLFNFRSKKKVNQNLSGNNIKTPDNSIMPPPLFNYFGENSDEILHLQSICFSINDILFLTDLIGRNIEKFSDLPKYNFFCKTYKRIVNEKNLLESIKNEGNSSDKSRKKPFFVIFKEEKNTQLENLMNKKKKDTSTFESVKQDSELICKRIKFCIKTILKGLNLLNNKDFAYLNFANSTDKFFSALKYTLDELGEYSELSNNIPIKWYAQYIYSYKKDLSKNYQENDFSKLYEEIYTEESNILKELKSLSNIVITRDGMNLRCAEKIIEKAKYELKVIEEVKKYIIIEKFIDEEKIEVCLMPNEELNNKINSNCKEMPLPLIINDIKCCGHSSNSNEKIPTHINYIKEFIMKFDKNITIITKQNKIGISDLIKFDIKKGKRNFQIHNIIGKYMDYVKKKIKSDSNKKLFGEIKEGKLNEISEKIENYILRHIYKYVYPKMQNEKDINFYKETKILEWIEPEHLEIKKLYVNQIKFAEKFIEKLDLAHSVYDKLDCINMAYVTMNNTIKFISGKNEEAGQDELTPLFQYILIKSQPKHLITNINYIKCFLNEDDLLGRRGFYVSQLESASSFILNINHEQLKISKEEFDLKTKQYLSIYNQEKKKERDKNNYQNNKT